MLKKFIPTAKQHFEFNKREYMDIILATLILSFIFSLSQWEGGLSYPFHLILILIIVFCTLLLHLTMQKLFAIYHGYSSEFKISLIGLLAALMIGFLTEIPSKDILLVLVIPGTLLYKIMPKHRIGRWPKGPNFSEMGFISVSGIMLNLILAVIFYGLFKASGVWFFWLITIINVFFAFGTILPIPKNDGLQLLYGSRISYVVTAILVIATSYFIFIDIGFLSVLLLSIITLIVVWAGYYYFIEKRYLSS